MKLPRVAYWFVGSGVALVGVAIVRLLTPQLPESLRIYGTSIGVTVAVVGILAAALGAGRVADSGPDEQPGEKKERP